MVTDADGQVVIIGAGPAGLTAAYELTKFNMCPIVLEKGDKVGGLSRTEVYKGFYFDMGGHRFFTKVEEVQVIWRALLGDQLLRRSRLSRIHYAGTFFHYPLKPVDALRGLGLWESVLVVISYLRWQLFPSRCEETYEQWVTNRFGRRLFRTFFKTYTEKVWGISCSELQSEWAAQRIKDLSLKTALLSSILKPRTAIRTLIEEFDYPQLGPGMMWTAAHDEIERRHGVVHLNSDVIRVNRSGNRIESVVVECNKKEEVIGGTAFISSMPITELVMKMCPSQPDVVAAAKNLPGFSDRRLDHRPAGRVSRQLDLYPFLGGPGRSDPEL
jgi:protoporphyrinogen oxidase